MKSTQKGSVLTEAILLGGLMITLLGAMHVSGRWQFAWLNHYLHTQTTATAIALEHHRASALGESLTISQREQTVDFSRTLSEREFAIGSREWLHLESTARFKQHAWRVVGTGQAASGQAVTQRLKNASVLWTQPHTKSQIAIAPLRASLVSVDAVWRSRGDMGDWLSKWQDHVPSPYLKTNTRERSAVSLFNRFVETVTP